MNDKLIVGEYEADIVHNTLIILEDENLIEFFETCPIYAVKALQEFTPCIILMRIDDIESIKCDLLEDTSSPLKIDLIINNFTTLHKIVVQHNRIEMPIDFLDYIDAVGQLTFIGIGTHIEIYSKKSWVNLRENNELKDEIRDIFDYMV